MLDLAERADYIFVPRWVMANASLRVLREQKRYPEAFAQRRQSAGGHLKAFQPGTPAGKTSNEPGGLEGNENIFGHRCWLCKHRPGPGPYRKQEQDLCFRVPAHQGPADWAVQEGLKLLAEKMPPGADIAGVGVTGSARKKKGTKTPCPFRLLAHRGSSGKCEGTFAAENLDGAIVICIKI